MATALFQTCKPKKELTGKEEKHENNKQLVSNDTLPIKDVGNKSKSDTTNQDIVQKKSTNDTITKGKIPLMNPKLYDPAYTIIDTTDYPEPEYAKFQTAPKIDRKEISNFNSFLENMYTGAKWYHDKHESIEYYVNRYRATYKGTEFSFQAINSFVYYFYDIGEITHEDIIKTAVYWIILPKYPNVVVNEIKLVGERDFNKTPSVKVKIKDYVTTCKINNETLEVYTVFEEYKLYSFKARLHNRLFCSYGSFY
jgi:hypothetical protein